MKGSTALWLFKILKKGSLISDIINYTAVKELKNLCRYLDVTTAGTIPETEPQNQIIQSKKDKSVIGIALSSKEKRGNWNTVWLKKEKKRIQDIIVPSWVKHLNQLCIQGKGNNSWTRTSARHQLSHLS